MKRPALTKAVIKALGSVECVIEAELQSDENRKDDHFKELRHGLEYIQRLRSWARRRGAVKP
jgi:hypothetical protein